MKKVIYKTWLNYEKEETWINNLANEGWSLIHMFHSRYVFEKTEPNFYVYRIQLLEHVVWSAKSKAYIAFVEETGIEYVSSWFRWVYFRKKVTDGPLELYTNRESQLNYFKMLYRFWISVGVLELTIGIFNTVVGIAVSKYLEAPFNFLLGLFLIFLSIIFFMTAAPIKKKISVIKQEMTFLE